MLKKIMMGIVVLLVILLGGAFYFLSNAMPTGSGYSAKYICSMVFLGNRNAEEVIENEIKPTHIIFNLVSSEVDREKKEVRSVGLGFLSPMTAIFRKGIGCTLAVNTSRAELEKQAQGIPARFTNSPELEWPAGDKVNLSGLPAGVDRAKLDKALDWAFSEPFTDKKRNTQAILVVYKGKVIAERYAKGINEKTPLLGWSMTKSATNTLVGLLVKDGKLDIKQSAPVKEWSKSGDPRQKITLDQLLRMSSGLAFTEVYAPFNDAPIMLYENPDMGFYAASKPLKDKPDTKWYYSSGTTNIIARIVKEKVGGDLASLQNFTHQRLLRPLGMSNTFIEPDASGTFVGSSYMFAPARDWARLGLLYLRDGVWNGQRLLPEGWVKYSSTPTPGAKKGQYGAQFWLNAGNKENPKLRRHPGLTRDWYFMSGYNAQNVCINKKNDLVVVRLGVTHNRAAWSPEEFLIQILDAVGQK